MPGARIKETQSPLQPKLPLSVGGSLCKLLWARGHLWPRVRKFCRKFAAADREFLTPVGGKSTPACSGCQGNITTYCIPNRDAPNGPYGRPPSTRNSQAFNNFVMRWAGGAGFWLIFLTWLGVSLMGPELLLHRAIRIPWEHIHPQKILLALCGASRRTTPLNNLLFYLCVLCLARLRILAACPVVWL